MTLLWLAFACAPEAAPLCPSYSGLTALGRTWEYEAFVGDERWTVELTELGVGGVTRVAEGWTETFLCDADGLWAVSRHESDGDAWAEWEFDPPALSMPAEIAPGDAWTTEAAWHYTDSAGVTKTESLSTQYEVVAAVESNVAAGSFEALELRVLGGQVGRDTEYRAAGVGLLLTDAAQLVEVAEP
ncbi:hypothetical protein LBMAG42_10400 [Deltaproteobacteria bacterium]|nr:hypothetical protein LBMAG42_10400 [Deltaproteobacteria bacterium]